MVSCPICNNDVSHTYINKHIDSDCKLHLEPPKDTNPAPAATSDESKKSVASIFSTASARKPVKTPQSSKNKPPSSARDQKPTSPTPQKRTLPVTIPDDAPQPKKQKASATLRAAMPLAELMRPQTLDDITGQQLVGQDGVLRGLIEEGRVPSMILWGSAGCGKTTIARVIANCSKARFVEIRATASGVAECKKVFAEAKSELLLTGRRTILCK